MRPVARALGRAAWGEAHERLVAHLAARPARFVVHPALGDALRERLGDRLSTAATDAAASARRIASGAYDLLGYEGLRFDSRPAGDIDWHLDPVSGRRAPRECWADVPYLDPSSGDHKVTWEINRHQHWLTLGRAWWLTGDPAHREAFERELESWLRANPPLLGINWASALELALRSLSWTWAAELFADPARSRGESPWTVDLLLGLDRQLRHVEKHLSRYFSPNTHLLGEGLALYVCGAVFPELRRSHERTRIGRGILLEGTTAQVLPDGGHAERSLHYHRYALDFYLLAIAVAARTADHALVSTLTPTARRMGTFLRALCDDRGHYPNIGDDDGGELTPIAGLERHARTTLGWASVLLDAPELRVDPVPEAVAWLTLTGPAAPTATPAGAPPRSVLFADTGYLAARRGATHLVFDVGPHGFMNGGHAHADALSLCLVVRGHPLLVDPGTGTYTVDAAVRDRYRSSRVHNTLSLDGRSQAVPRGPFQWATTASAELRFLATNPSFDYAEADTRAWAPALHERIVLFVSDDTWIVADRVLGGGTHEVTLTWQLDPQWVPEGTSDDGDEERGRSYPDGEVHLSHASGTRVRIAMPGARVSVRRGALPQEPGTVSPVYGRYVASHVIEAKIAATAPCWIVTAIDVLAARDVRRGGVRVQPVSQAPGAPVAVVSAKGEGTDVTLCRGRSPRELVTFSIGDTTFATDARMAHVRLDHARRPGRLCVADATVLRCDGPGPVSLSADDPILDLAAVFTGRGAPIVETSAPRRSFSIDVEGPSAGPQSRRHARPPGREASARTR
jgi:hypothetical protein